MRTVDVYDSNLNQWSLAPPMGTARSGHGVAVLNNFIYAVRVTWLYRNKHLINRNVLNLGRRMGWVHRTRNCREIWSIYRRVASSGFHELETEQCWRWRFEWPSLCSKLRIGKQFRNGRIIPICLLLGRGIRFRFWSMSSVCGMLLTWDWYVDTSQGNGINLSFCTCHILLMMCSLD